MSWKPEVFVQGKWQRNGLVFQTEREARENASDLMDRWTAVDDSRAVEVDEPAKHTYYDRQLGWVVPPGPVIDDDRAAAPVKLWQPGNGDSD